MDRISRIRAKNMLDSLLVYCDNAEGDEEKVVLLRMCIVTVNKLRMHSGVDTMLGCDVRDLNKQAELSGTRDNFLNLWDKGVDLVQAYKEALSA